MEYQKIIRNDCLFSGTNVIVDNMIKIYQIYSNLSSIEETSTMFDIDTLSIPYINELEKGLSKKQKYILNEYEWYGDLNCSGDKIVVCFSGGKDSTALAKKLIDDGSDIILFHLHGINKSYPKEVEHAKSIAQKLGVDIIIENISLSGKTDFLENPTKNQVVCSFALLYALKNGYSHKIAFGDFTSDIHATSAFDRNWSDSQENWSGFISYVRNYIKDFDVIIPFETYKDSFDIISKDIQLLNMVQSCILPDRFRSMTKRNNEKKFKVKLLDNRCGSCWKCCVEWMMLVNNGVLEYNKDFYEHCINFLKGKQKVEFPNSCEISEEKAYELFMKSKFIDSLYYKREKI